MASGVYVFSQFLLLVMGKEEGLSPLLPYYKAYLFLFDCFLMVWKN